MIHITRNIAIDESETQLEFMRASNPGGQDGNEKEQLRDEFFRANEEYSQALEELRQLVYESMGTPEKPREPTLESLERMHSLIWQAKEAYGRMIELYERLRKSEGREANKPSFGPRLLSHSRATGILAEERVDFSSPETANGLGPEAQGVVTEGRRRAPRAGDWVVILGPTLFVWAIVAILFRAILKRD
jgi:hypothetical protein